MAGELHDSAPSAQMGHADAFDVSSPQSGAPQGAVVLVLAPPRELPRQLDPLMQERAKRVLEDLPQWSAEAALVKLRDLAEERWQDQDYRMGMDLADAFIALAARLPSAFVMSEDASVVRLAPKGVRSDRLFAFYSAWQLRMRAQANLARLLKPQLDMHGPSALSVYRPLVSELTQATCEAKLHIALWIGDIVAVQSGGLPVAEPHTYLSLRESAAAYNQRVRAAGGSRSKIWRQWELDVHARMFGRPSATRDGC